MSLIELQSWLIDEGLRNDLDQLIRCMLLPSLTTWFPIPGARHRQHSIGPVCCSLGAFSLDLTGERIKKRRSASPLPR